MLLQNCFSTVQTKWVRLAIIPKNDGKYGGFAS